MKIHRFDPTAGKYRFELSEIQSAPHAHPAAECILAREGTFDLTTDAKTYSKLRYALLPPGASHQITTRVKGRFELQMVELFPARTHFPLVYGTDPATMLRVSEHFLTRTNPPLPDERLNEVLEFLKVPDQDLLPDWNRLATRVHLSPSRLSHLFRAQTGMSLQRYLLWCRLRTTVAHYLHRPDSLRDAAQRSGFYDNAHLNRTFRKFFGVAPSFAYNSRNGQVD